MVFPWIVWGIYSAQLAPHIVKNGRVERALAAGIITLQTEWQRDARRQEAAVLVLIISGFLQGFVIKPSHSISLRCPEFLASFS